MIRQSRKRTESSTLNYEKETRGSWEKGNSDNANPGGSGKETTRNPMMQNKTNAEYEV